VVEASGVAAVLREKRNGNASTASNVAPGARHHQDIEQQEDQRNARDLDCADAERSRKDDQRQQALPESERVRAPPCLVAA
jgi:hypothetical protein